MGALCSPGDIRIVRSGRFSWYDTSSIRLFDLFCIAEWVFPVYQEVSILIIACTGFMDIECAYKHTWLTRIISATSRSLIQGAGATVRSA